MSNEKTETYESTFEIRARYSFGVDGDATQERAAEQHEHLRERIQELVDRLPGCQSKHVGGRTERIS